MSENGSPLVIPHAMIATVDFGGLIEFLFLPSTNISDDDQEVIGLSRVVYLSRKDPGHIFLPDARWHDAAYTAGASIQETWPRWKVDLEWLTKMMNTAGGDLALEREAITLYLLVRKYGQKAWEGQVPETEGVLTPEEFEMLSKNHPYGIPARRRIVQDKSQKIIWVRNPQDGKLSTLPDDGEAVFFKVFNCTILLHCFFRNNRFGNHVVESVEAWSYKSF